MRIVIVDQHPLFREGMALVFSRVPGLTVVGDGALAEDAVRLASSLKPDIMLFCLDIVGNGLPVLQQIGEVSPATKTIILTDSQDVAPMLATMRNGACGYILNTITVQRLIEIIFEVHAGISYVPQEMAMQVLRNVANTRMIPNPDRLTILSDREREILTMVSDGLSNRQIATTLNRTEAVIKNRMTAIMKKLHVHNRVQAAMILNHEV
jgi:DNA-binding NarL/FixJ family response regulator